MTDFYSNPQKVVGWEITVQFYFNSGKPEQAFHWIGTEAACRRKGMLKSNAEKIVKADPITAEEWLRAYGDPRLRL